MWTRVNFNLKSNFEWMEGNGWGSTETDVHYRKITEIGRYWKMERGLFMNCPLSLNWLWSCFFLVRFAEDVPSALRTYRKSIVDRNWNKPNLDVLWSNRIFWNQGRNRVTSDMIFIFNDFQVIFTAILLTWLDLGLT